MRRRSCRPSRLLPGLVLALALSGTADAAQIAARRYTVEEGLAHNFVTDIYQDSHGYIWFGTIEGLSRFDGERLVSYGTADGLPDATIAAIVEDAQGRLWVATRLGGLSRLIDDPAQQPQAGGRRSRFKTYSLSSKPGADSVSAILADPDGSLWCLTYGGLFRVRLDKERLSAEEIATVSDQGGNLRAFADRRGRLWFACDRELLLVDRGRVTRFTAADGIGDAWIVGIAESRTGRIFGANIHQLFEFVEAGAVGRWRPVGLRLPASEEYRSLLVDSRDQLWIGATAGLFSGPAAFPERLSRAAALETAVEALFEDRGRSLWMGTSQAGAWLIPPERITSYMRADGLPSAYVRKVHEAAEGRIVVVTDAGLAEIGGAVARPLPTPSGITIDSTTGRMVIDRRGTWWIGDHRGLWRVRDPLVRPVPELVSGHTTPGAEPVPQPFEDSAGRVWFTGAKDKIFRIDDPDAAVVTPHAVPLGPNPPIWSANLIGQASGGGIWLGSHGALARLGPGGAQVFELSGNILPRAIYTDSRGWLWVGTRYGGVIVTRHPEAAQPVFDRYMPAQGLASSAVWAITEDGFGRMYFGTGRGLDRLDVATGRIRHFGTGDGLAGAVVTDCRRDAAGRIWIATSTGLSLLVPEPPAVDASPPAVLFTRVRAAGDELPILERGTPRLSAIVLPPSRPDLLVEFVNPGERGRRYEYRLGGGETPWTAVPGDRSLALARLSSGSYRLSVRAAALEGLGPGIPAEIEFEVLRPLWQRGWFAASTLGAVGLLLAGAHRMRVKRLLALERIRRQVALDLHDDIGSGLAQIAVLNEVAKRHADPEMAGLLDESAGVARQMRESMSDIVWAVDPRRDTLTDLVQRMRQAAFDLLQPQGLRVSFSAPEDRALAGIALAPDRRKHLLLILKEAVTNIARHAQASSVEIALSLDHKRLRLRVADDGRGFDSAGSGGTGLHSFQSRAAELGGTATVTSSPGAGTTLEVSAPIA